MRFNNFIRDLLGDPAQIACLKYLRYHENLSGRELAKLAGVSQFKIRSVLQNLSRQGLLKMVSVGRAYLYSLNREHFLVGKVLPILEAEGNFPTIFGAWIMERLSLEPLSIILFGSIARNEERPDSDIDLLFVFKKIASEGNLLREIQESLADTPQIFGNRIAPILTKPEAFSKAIKKRDPFFLQILKEGIVIAGIKMNEILV